SDPLIEKLGLQNVSEALTSAVAGQLNEPPQSWFSDVKWAIPNNLPKMFPHEITGLLGRETEFKELNRLLLLPRENLITIVAPGGIGKTALVLQLLKDLSLTPSFSKQVDRIIFCSLKNEELTADGLRKIDAVKDIDSIKSHIFNELRDLYPERTFGSFEEACVELNDEKILLCIDNLETLLIESQHEFQQFNQELPLRWKVLVTSRVSLGAGTSVPLEPLKQKHSVALARNYFRKRGVMNIQQRTLQDIAKAANHNPLAIRLTVDLYLKGNDIPESIQRSQKDIASFSYKNLIDAIDDTAVSILEAIFAQQV
ncbi:ATP-binding protein, partial [Vibrio anguillarum]